MADTYSRIKVCKQLLKGKTVWRSLLNLSLSNIRLNGKIIDLGSKAGNSSYYEFFKFNTNVDITYTDIEQSKTGNTTRLQLDVEKPFPLNNETYDVVLALNLFEHVYNFSVYLKEIFRILKKGGSLIVATPFMHEYHADLMDYYRFTDDVLRKIWKDAGFTVIELRAIGEGLFVLCISILSKLLPRFLRAIVLVVNYIIFSTIDKLLDRILPRIFNKTFGERFALGGSS